MIHLPPGYEPPAAHTGNSADYAGQAGSSRAAGAGEA